MQSRESVEMARIPQRPQRARIFVGCEGDSERAYAIWLQRIADSLHLPLSFDPFIAGGGDPLAIVQRCLKGMWEGERKRGAYRHKFILLDSDRLKENADRDREMMQISKQDGVTLLFQEYEHEALLLRHCDGCHTHRPPAGCGESGLKVHWPDYKKPAAAADLFKHYQFEHLRRACTMEHDLRRFLKQLGFPLPA